MRLHLKHLLNVYIALESVNTCGSQEHWQPEIQSVWSGNRKQSKQTVGISEYTWNWTAGNTWVWALPFRLVTRSLIPRFIQQFCSLSGVGNVGGSVRIYRGNFCNQSGQNVPIGKLYIIHNTAAPFSNAAKVGRMWWNASQMSEKKPAVQYMLLISLWSWPRIEPWSCSCQMQPRVLPNLAAV